jgi:hypothetical protein
VSDEPFPIDEYHGQLVGVSMYLRCTGEHFSSFLLFMAEGWHGHTNEWVLNWAYAVLASGLFHQNRTSFVVNNDTFTISCDGRSYNLLGYDYLYYSWQSGQFMNDRYLELGRIIPERGMLYFTDCIPIEDFEITVEKL